MNGVTGDELGANINEFGSDKDNGDGLIAGKARI